MNTCCYNVVIYQGLARYSHICGNKATVENKGKWYCGRHSPEAIQARRDKSTKHYNDKWAAVKSKEEAHEQAIRASQDAKWREKLLELTSLGPDVLTGKACLQCVILDECDPKLRVSCPIRKAGGL